MPSASPERSTLLHCLLYWEQRAPQQIYLTQPYPDGSVQDWTWQQVGDEVRRIAQHLQSIGLPAHSNIALLGRNSAYWIMADLAIWMAGHVTVPLYPTFRMPVDPIKCGSATSAHPIQTSSIALPKMAKSK